MISVDYAAFALHGGGGSEGTTRPRSATAQQCHRTTAPQLQRRVKQASSPNNWPSTIRIRIIDRDRRGDHDDPSTDWATPVGGRYPVTNSSRAARDQAAADHRPVGSHASHHTGES